MCLGEFRFSGFSKSSGSSRSSTTSTTSPTSTTLTTSASSTTSLHLRPHNPLQNLLHFLLIEHCLNITTQYLSFSFKHKKLSQELLVKTLQPMKARSCGQALYHNVLVYLMLYAPTTEWRRAQLGANERSEFKKYFSFNFILTGFLFNNQICFFVLDFGQRVMGECPKSKTPKYS